MNAAILLAIVLCVFAMGYRFYAKFLVLAVFRPGDDASVPAHSRGDPHDFRAAGRWQLAGFQAAAGSGLLAVAGAGIGVAWGWVPAFLWIVVGTLVAGGTYALAALWSSLREDGNSLAGVFFGTAGAWAALPVFLLGSILLVLICTVTVVLLGQLLQTHPEATWCFLALLAATVPARKMISPASGTGAVLWGLAAGGLLLAGVYLGQALPLHISGVLALDIHGIGVLRIPGETIWVGIALAAAFMSINAPVAAAALPRGVLVGILIAALMLLVAAGLIVSSPPMVAPEFNTGGELPDPFPLLFIAITTGAISGVCALIATGPTMRQVDRHADVPVITFSGALSSGALAALVLLVLCAGFAEPAEWTAIYGSLPAQADVFTWIDLAITKAGRFAAALGIPMPVAVAIVAAILACMAYTMLESVLRALSYGVEEFAEDFALERLKGRKQRARIALAVVAATAFLLLQTDLGLNHWLFLGLTNQLFAGAVMLLLGLVLLRRARGAAFVLVPAAFVLVCAFWGLSWLLPHWWDAGNRTLFALAIVTGVLASVSVVACIHSLARNRRKEGAAASPDTL